MNAKYFLFFLAFSLIYFGCKKDNPVEPPVINTTGKVLLKIDRTNAPEGITLVTATLTRDNYTPITGSLNLLSDTTADLSLNSIPVGNWLLTVDAKDSAGVIKFSGSSEVTIFEAMITQVSLTLSPTTTGVGGIYIYVSWGTPSGWIDHSHNPILLSSGLYWDNNGVQQPKILYENNQYKMYYLGLAGGSSSSVGYAISSDGFNWTKPFSQPVLSPGNYNSWDATTAAAGAIIHESNGYKMYYVGWSNHNANWHIGLATSSDGINWTKHPNPVIYGTNGWEYQLVPSSIMKIQGVYYLYYYGINSQNYKIGLATSVDGINWTKHSSNPILSPTQTWEGTGVGHPSVIKDGDVFKMIYMGGFDYSFGMATSTDGVNWTKVSSNPFFTKQNTHNNWASGGIAYPNFIKIGNEYRIYYSGLFSGSSQYRIGVARKSN